MELYPAPGAQRGAPVYYIFLGDGCIQIFFLSYMLVSISARVIKHVSADFFSAECFDEDRR